MTKEEKREYHRKYREVNKDTRNRSECKKRYRESQKDGLFTVYLLPEEKYVGITTSLKARLTKHRSAKYNRNTTDAKVLGKYATKKEALTVEASYHAKGYLGRNSTYK